MYKRKRPGCTHLELITYEVQWYEKHGKYLDDRIKTDPQGHRYVESDSIWNRRNRYRRESIWRQLADHVQFKITGIKGNLQERRRPA